ncbi:MAG: helix-turn-helix transcriptional regulator [Clostridia bacterium]|nr:helix-turn-helix transcriptional regulator [Clostridia bacterium]MBO5440247.1 helix-turn-helix transcriptional regulator [Clostridia bacterium]
MHYYQRIRDLREDNDKKQEEIALVLGITRPQYHLYESGKREMPMHLFMKLAKFYNVSLDYLSGLIDIPERLDRKPSK